MGREFVIKEQLIINKAVISNDENFHYINDVFCSPSFNHMAMV